MSLIIFANPYNHSTKRAINITNPSQTAIKAVTFKPVKNFFPFFLTSALFLVYNKVR